MKEIYKIPAKHKKFWWSSWSFSNTIWKKIDNASAFRKSKNLWLKLTYLKLSLVVCQKALFLNFIIMPTTNVVLLGNNIEEASNKVYWRGQGNSLKNELQIPKESKQLIRNLNKKPIKMTKFGQTKLRLVNWKLILEKFVENDNIFTLKIHWRLSPILKTSKCKILVKVNIFWKFM